MSFGAPPSICGVHGEPCVCGLDAAMDVVRGKWKALILWALNERTRRFGELKRTVPGVSEKMLAQRDTASERTEASWVLGRVRAALCGYDARRRWVSTEKLWSPWPASTALRAMA